MTDLHVLVAGGGLGGLCLANGLHRAGVSVAVYEKDPSPASRRQGYRITLGPDGSRALRACLPADAYELFEATCGMPRAQTVLWDADLTRRQADGPDPGPGADTPLDRPVSVNRATLRQILLAGLGGVVRYGSALSAYRAEPGGTVTAQFADGRHATGDVLVAADGAGSVIRRQYLPHLHTADTALRVIYGKIPLTSQTTPAVAAYLPVLFTAVIGADRSSVNLAPMRYPGNPAEAAARLCPRANLDDNGGDYLMCVLAARRERFPGSDQEMTAMDGTQLQHTAARLISRWHPRVRQLIDLQDPASLFYLPICTSVPPAQPWTTTHVTLLGDAIHAMSPALGSGASIALRDAALLCRHLTRAARGQTPLRHALRRYEIAMTSYGFDAVRASADRGHRLFGQDPLPAPPATSPTRRSST